MAIYPTLFNLQIIYQNNLPNFLLSIILIFALHVIEILFTIPKLICLFISIIEINTLLFYKYRNIQTIFFAQLLI